MLFKKKRGRNGAVGADDIGLSPVKDNPGLSKIRDILKSDSFTSVCLKFDSNLKSLKDKICVFSDSTEHKFGQI